MMSLVPSLVEDPAAAEAEGLGKALERLRQRGCLPYQPTGKQSVLPRESEPRAAPLAHDAAPEESAPAAAAPPPAEKEEKTPPRQTMVRISHERLNELLIRADEALTVKISARQQAAGLRHLSKSLDQIRGRLRSSTTFAETPELASPAAFSLLDHFHEELRQIVREADDHARESGRAIEGLRERAQAVFMRSASHLLDVFPKMVRDLSRSQGKRVELMVSGGQIPVDQRVLDGLMDPLTHLVRNAIDHGIESPEERARAGKEEKGRLRIELFQPHPGRIELIVEDDGPGLPMEALRERAVEQGLLTPRAAGEASAENLTALIFESGFSTRSEVSSISGRGLGLAIVREKIERLGGQVSVRSEPGKGAIFLIALPSTMVVFRGLSVQVGGQTFILLAGQVEGVVGFRQDQIVSTQDTPTFPYEEELLPLLDLSRLLKFPDARKENSDRLRQAVVVRSASERAVLIVDEILREDDFPVRPFSPPLVRVKGIFGAALLPSGEPLPILQVDDLLESAFKWVSPAQAGDALVPRAQEERAQKTVLVADDSITSRALLKNILEAAGYHVVLAVDGRDALSALRLQAVDLVVSDVEMPRMDGFELTEKIRSDAAFGELPVILVTALATDRDREKGLEAGANQYIIKTEFEEGHLLAAVQRLL